LVGLLSFRRLAGGIINHHKSGSGTGQTFASLLRSGSEYAVSRDDQEKFCASRLVMEHHVIGVPESVKLDL